MNIDIIGMATKVEQHVRKRCYYVINICYYMG